MKLSSLPPLPRALVLVNALLFLLGGQWLVATTAQEARHIRLAAPAAEVWPTGPRQADETFGPQVLRPAAVGEIASLAAFAANAPILPTRRLEAATEERLPATWAGASAFEPDAVLQTTHGPTLMPTPVANFDGLLIAEAGNLLPPDTNGDIGYDPATGKRYYFEWVNVAYKAWEVTDPAAPVVVLPATSGNTLWAAALPNSPCALHNDGDPIVLFDEHAHRWFLSQFVASAPFYQCVAVSQTPNPAGAWYVYAYFYSNNELNDYPHFGVWPDPVYNAYLMTAHEFEGNNWSGQAAAALDRAKLLAGDETAALVVFDLYNVNPNFGGMLPADLDGLAPQAGTPGFFFEVDDSLVIGGLSDAMRVWEMRPNWDFPTASTFGFTGQPNYINTVVGFNRAPCVISDTRSCVPQPGTTQRLDAVADRLMYRVAFRNFGDYQSAVFNHTVWADGADRLGVRWYEARRNLTNGVWFVHQQGTYAPADGHYRWMGSAAQDAGGNLAIGYSIASGALNPSIRYAGRLVTDPLNTLPQSEVTLITGSGAQTSSTGRWGDYSMLGVDPEDGCTFWYAQQYHGPTASANWRTRIGAFKFPECRSHLLVEPSVTVCQGQTLSWPVRVGDGLTPPVNLSVSGQPNLTATFDQNPVNSVPTRTALTFSNTGGAALGVYTLTLTATAANTTTIAPARLEIIPNTLGATNLASPADGATNVPLDPILVWTTVNGAGSYTVEIARDAAFAQIIYTSSTLDAARPVPQGTLLANTTYYWRVRAANACGMGGYSAVKSFTTTAQFCRAINAPLLDNSYLTDTFTLADFGVLQDLNLNLSATHSYVGDLVVTLRHVESGTSVMLLNRPNNTLGNCRGNDLANLTLDDEPSGGPGTGLQSSCVVSPTTANAYQTNGSYTPLNPLAAFDGKLLTGDWQLGVRDANVGDTGVLQQWCLLPTMPAVTPALVLTKTVGTDPATCATTTAINVLGPTNVTYCFKVQNTGNLTLTTHSLVDGQLGQLLNNQSFTLAPQATTYVTRTVLASMSSAGSATWTAYYGSYNASGSGSASVTLTPVTPGLLLTATVGLNPAQCATTTTLDIIGPTAVVYCFKVQNTGNITFTTHTLHDSQLGQVYNNQGLTLAPQATTFVTQLLTVTTSIANTGVWTATNGAYSAVSSAQAQVNYTPLNLGLVFTLTVGRDATQCATAPQLVITGPTNVTYCYQARNTGNLTYTLHTLATSNGVEFNNAAFVMPPGGGGVLTRTALVVANTTHTATWRATGGAHTISASDLVTVLLTAPTSPIVELNPWQLTAAVGAGQSTTRALTLTNVGGSALNWNLTDAYGAYRPAPGTKAPATWPAALSADRDTAWPSPATPAQAELQPTVPLAPAFALTENFNNVPGLPAYGWAMINHSNPLGETGWFQGNPTIFPAHNGDFPAYVAANFRNVGSVGTISNWLLTPEIELRNGAQLTFYTRGRANNNYPDRLQVRLSTAGASTEVGSDENGVGDFTTLLLDINPTLITGTSGYPATWTLYTLTVSGLVTPTTGRFAFRYFVTNAGANAPNSNYIGIDAVQYQPPTANCAAPTPIPWLSVTPLSGTTAPSANSVVQLTFNTTGLTPGSTYTGKLCLASNAPATPALEVPVALYVAPQYGVSLSADTLAQTGYAGASVYYTLHLTNTADAPDTFHASVTNAPTFPVNTPTTIGPLAPGASVTFTVQVRIPGGIAENTLSTANYLITSQGNPAQTATTSFTTIAIWTRLRLPVIWR